MARKKFGFSQELTAYLIGFMEKYGIEAEPEHADIMLPDMKDLPFYEAVIDKRHPEALLVTGNKKHFPSESFIVTPRELLEILE